MYLESENNSLWLKHLVLIGENVKEIKKSVTRKIQTTLSTRLKILSSMSFEKYQKMWSNCNKDISERWVLSEGWVRSGLKGRRN
jgi:hypothetical protein